MPRTAIFALAMAIVTAACGNKIGDSCNVSSDCAQDGSRVCDTFSPGGSCTIAGCDYGTCPDEALCVRFFPALENASMCTGQSECAIDEVCTVGSQCAPRTIEQRFCMLSCEGGDDCREGYECRDRGLMINHGGEPVPNPLAPTVVPTSRFCAPLRGCVANTDCPMGEVCTARFCIPM